MCGIFGIINKKEDVFDYKTFCTLGIANDRRGGDSCGIFIDKEVEYGIKDTAKFENFFWTSKLLQETLTCQVALGHDRKASIGGITLEKAHPIVIKNDKDEIEFVLVHNGTIHNYENLAEKYLPKKNVDGLSDSQVLALILYNKGFDVLSKYNGGTAFICTDYRSGKPITYFYKGESKDDTFSKEESVERPLYFYKDNDKLIISSIASYLAVCTAGEEEEVYEVPGNTVLRYEDGKLYTYKKIDRSKCYQKNQYTSTYGGNLYGGYYTYVGADYISLDAENRLYKIDKKPITGEYCISNYGRVLIGKEKDQFENHTVYFYEGMAMKSKKHFQIAKLLCKKSGLNDSVFVEVYDDIVRYLTVDELVPRDKTVYKAIAPGVIEPFTGTAQMLTMYNKLSYINGVAQGTVSSDCKSSFNYDFASWNKENFKDLYKKCLESMNRRKK